MRKRFVLRLLSMGVIVLCLPGWYSDPMQYRPVSQAFNYPVFGIRPISFDGGNSFINVFPGITPTVQLYDGTIHSFGSLEINGTGYRLNDTAYDGNGYVGLAKGPLAAGYNMNYGTFTTFSGYPAGGFSRLVAIGPNTFIAGKRMTSGPGDSYLQICKNFSCTDLTTGPKATAARQTVYSIDYKISLGLTFAGTSSGGYVSTNNRDFLSMTGLPPGKVFAIDGNTGDWFAATDSGGFGSANPGGPYSPSNSGLNPIPTYTIDVRYDLKKDLIYRLDRDPYLSVSERARGGSSWNSSGQINVPGKAYQLGLDPATGRWQVGSSAGLIKQNATGFGLENPGAGSLGVSALDFTNGVFSAGGDHSYPGFAESTNYGASYNSDPFTLGMSVCGILKDGIHAVIATDVGVYVRPSPSSSFAAINGPPPGTRVLDVALSPGGRAILAQDSYTVSVSVSSSDWQNYVPWSAGLDPTDKYKALVVLPSSTAVFGEKNSFVSPGIGSSWTPFPPLPGGTIFKGTAALAVGDNILAGGREMVNPPGFNLNWFNSQGSYIGSAGNGIPAKANYNRFTKAIVPNLSFDRDDRTPLAAGSTTYLFAATSEGLYVSTDNAQNWSLLSQALGTAPVSSVAADATHVWVGTEGQGLVAYVLPLRFERLVPIAVDVTSPNAHYTTDLAVTNRGLSTVTFTAQYTASMGSGSGTVNDSLAPGEQKAIPDALAYLRLKGLPIPTGGSQGGTLLFTFYGATSDAAPAVTARTTALTGPPLPVGRAGLAYSAIDPATGTDGSLILYGLRSDGNDRSNVAVFNTSDQPVSVRVTAYSGAGDGASTVIASSDTLPAWGWKQYNGILDGPGYASGWVKVERVSGARTYFSAYAVINNKVTNDGSYVQPALVPLFPSYANIPVLAETPEFGSEIILANSGPTTATFALSYQESQTGTASGTAMVMLPPKSQLIQPNAIAWLRSQGIPIGPQGAGSYVGSVHLIVTGASPTDTWAGARTSSPVLIPASRADIPAEASASPLLAGGGEFGTFTPANPPGEEGSTEVYVYALKADAENRSNVAVMHVGDPDDGPITLSVQAYDGDAGGVPKGTPATVTLNPGQWHQLNGFLGQQGIANGWAKVTRTAGVANWIAYGVVNDGAAPGLRTGDGSYIPMSR
ncbi:MAG: hypothetical protein ACHQPI_09170 [Thermoanaerobaculia bacterium]